MSGRKAVITLEDTVNSLINPIADLGLDDG